MSRWVSCAITFTVFAVSPSSPGVVAAQATPEASPISVEAANCTVEPLTTAEMRTVIERQVPRVLANYLGTPIGDQEMPADYDREDGVPADAATVAEVTEIVIQYVACLNAGRLPSVAALMTEQGAGAYLSFGLLATAAVLPGATPTADFDPLLLNSFLGVIQMSAPPPEEFRLRLYSIDRVVQVEDGRVLAFVTVAAGSSAPASEAFLLRHEDGRYRIVFGDEAEGEVGATPVASPVP